MRHQLPKSWCGTTKRWTKADDGHQSFETLHVLANSFIAYLLYKVGLVLFGFGCWVVDGRVVEILLGLFSTVVSRLAVLQTDSIER